MVLTKLCENGRGRVRFVSWVSENGTCVCCLVFWVLLVSGFVVILSIMSRGSVRVVICYKLVMMCG